MSSATPMEIVVENDQIKVQDEDLQKLSQEAKLVYFDTETTGLSSIKDELIQIAAVCLEYGEFNTYILPKRQVNSRASAVNGLTVIKLKGTRRLIRKFKHGGTQELDAVGLKEGMAAFAAYLQGIPGPIVLVGHNAKRFDIRFVFANLKRVGLIEDFLQTVCGLVDTMLVFRKTHPELKMELGGYSQGGLYKKFVGGGFEGHNAVEDSDALKKLVQAAEIPTIKLLEFGFAKTDVLYTNFLK